MTQMQRMHELADRQSHEQMIQIATIATAIIFTSTMRPFIIIMRWKNIAQAPNTQPPPNSDKKTENAALKCCKA